METSSFWISPERMRGSKIIRRCTSCGANLFRTKSDYLEFHGTHPRSVICMTCKDTQETREVTLHLGLPLRSIVSAMGSLDASRPTSIAVVLLASLVLVSLLTASAGIRSLNLVVRAEPFEGISDLILVYVPHHQDQVTKDYLSPYVSYLDENGMRREWLFDTFLFIARSPNPWSPFWGNTKASDWRWWINKIFQKDHQVDALNKEVGRVKRSLGELTKRGVILSLPYPSPLTDNFDMRSRDGSYLNFMPSPGYENRSMAHRLEACLWFVTEVIRNWETHDFSNLELLGFYWFHEELPEADVQLINAVADHIHAEGYRLYWIPYNSDENIEAVESYRKGELGFDYVWIQPNYAFRNRPTEGTKEMRGLEAIAKTADALNASIEIEMDKDPFLRGNATALKDFYYYLDSGVTYSYMNKPLAYYVFPKEMYLSQRPAVRQSYDALCDFVKGRYEPMSQSEISPSLVP